MRLDSRARGMIVRAPPPERLLAARVRRASGLGCAARGCEGCFFVLQGLTDHWGKVESCSGVVWGLEGGDVVGKSKIS